MALILTFLGKGGTGRTKMAIAAAKRLASQQKRVLLAGLDSGPAFQMLVSASLGAEPQEIAPNLQAVQFQTTALLERSWEDVKKLEAQYLRTPILKEVYGQELSVLPGMDSALGLNAVREYDASGKYDIIIYDGAGDSSTLRLLGMPDTLSWYIRRFSKLLADSDLGKTVSPFIQPLVSTVLNVSWTSDPFSQPTSQVSNLLDQGKTALADPNRVAAYLVTTSDPAAIATARYLWGSAQQVGLTVGGVILNQVAATEAPSSETLPSDFSPLQVSVVPNCPAGEWQPIIDALPEFTPTPQVPKPIEIDIPTRQVRLFLPGFDKKQVKLTQSGPDVTIEAGDQRRHISLPSALSGRQISAAKFQNGYLTITF